MTVALPGNSVIFVDAKVPLAAYRGAIEAKEEAPRRERLRAHAQAMKMQVHALARKNYQRAIGSAEFVVMFVPGEAFLSAACTENPDLIEYGAAKGIYLASPLTLIALLRSYALGWQQRQQEENAKQIAAVDASCTNACACLQRTLRPSAAAWRRPSAHDNSAVGSLKAASCRRDASSKKSPHFPMPSYPTCTPSKSPRAKSPPSAPAPPSRANRAPPELFNEEDVV